jgi:hypothetical protein
MIEAWLKSFLEAPWSASLVVLIAALIGGAASFLASWLAMRGSLRAQFGLQQNEWQRLDAERVRERADREQREQEEQKRSDAAATRAVAVEALFNSMSLLGLAKIRLTPREPSVISREQYDRGIESLMRAADSGSVQLLTNLYASIKAFELSIAEKSGGMVIADRAVARARDLSFQFEVMFRTFGQKVFTPSDMQTFEQTLNVAKVELGG